jgi:hypothetical protein
MSVWLVVAAVAFLVLTFKRNNSNSDTSATAPIETVRVLCFIRAIRTVHYLEYTY